MNAGKPKKKVRFIEGHTDMETMEFVDLVKDTSNRSATDTRKKLRKCSCNRPHDIEADAQNKPECHSLFFRYVCILGVTAFILIFASVLIYNAFFPKPSQSCSCLIAERYLQPLQVYAQLDTLTEVTCYAEGAENCKAICTALAMTTPQLYRELICEKQRDTDNFQGTLHYRPCPGSVWQPTSYHMKVCCTHGTQVRCN